MTIIEEINRIAERCENHGMVTIAMDARNIADRLERSGALVPVPDGEAGNISDLEPSIFSFDGKNWLWDSNTGWYSPDDETARLPYTHDGDLVVQPVHMVPITEWQIDEN